MSSSKSGGIRITGNFLDLQSTATGALVIVYSLTDDSNVQYITTIDVEQRFDIDVTDLSASTYGVSTFVLEDGVPFERAVAFPRFVIISNDTLKGLFEFYIASSTGHSKLFNVAR